MTLLCRYSTDFVSDSFNLVIEGSLFVEIPELVPVGLVLEISLLLLSQSLPPFSNLLHDLKSTHFLMLLYYLRTSLKF